ncbi:hypothetical protein ACVXZZ_06930 [Staphylococcus aureus]
MAQSADNQTAVQQHMAQIMSDIDDGAITFITRRVICKVTQ